MLYSEITGIRRRLLSNRLSQLKQRYGEKNLDPNWLLPDQKGNANFAVWLELLYRELPRTEWSKYCLKRRDEKLPWVESNCHLVSLKSVFEKTPRQKISDSTIENILLYLEDNPKAAVIEIARIYGLSQGAVSRIKRGYHRVKN